MVHSTWFLKLHRDIMGRGHIPLGKCLNKCYGNLNTQSGKKKARGKTVLMHSNALAPAIP